MAKIKRDRSGERLEADSRNDSSDEEREKRKRLARGGV
jgi:hypothetical protein